MSADPQVHLQQASKDQTLDQLRLLYAEVKSGKPSNIARVTKKRTIKNQTGQYRMVYFLNNDCAKHLIDFFLHARTG